MYFILCLRLQTDLYKQFFSSLCGRSSGVERYLAKVNVVSSNLIARSKLPTFRSATVRLAFLCLQRILIRKSFIAVSITKFGDKYELYVWSIAYWKMRWLA